MLIEVIVCLQFLFSLCLVNIYQNSLNSLYFVRYKILKILNALEQSDSFHCNWTEVNLLNKIILLSGEWMPDDKSMVVSKQSVMSTIIKTATWSIHVHSTKLLWDIRNMACGHPNKVHPNYSSLSEIRKKKNNFLCPHGKMYIKLRSRIEETLRRKIKNKELKGLTDVLNVNLLFLKGNINIFVWHGLVCNTISAETLFLNWIEKTLCAIMKYASAYDTFLIENRSLH